MQEGNHQAQDVQNQHAVADAPAKKQRRTRTRKTIEQELAELKARKQKLLENKRKAEVQDKLIFGATVIAMLKNMMKNNDPLAKELCARLQGFAKSERSKDSEIVEKVIASILE